MKQTKKLNISPLPEQTENYSHYEESEVRWDRIIFAGVVFVLLLALGIYLVMGDDAERAGTKPDEPTAASLESETPSIPLLEKASKETEMKVKGKETIEPVASRPVAAIKQEKPLEVTVELATEPKVIELPVVTETPAVDQSAVVAIKSEVETRPEVETKPEVETNPASVLIVNSAISRAALSLTVKDDEPGVPLNTSVVMPKEGIIKVILFTEMNHLRGNTLYHEWYRNGKRQARVKIPVNVDPQRSHSSKYINLHMLGQWQVKVIDGQGEPYVMADFEVISP